MIYATSLHIDAYVPKRSDVTGSRYVFRLTNTISHMKMEWGVVPDIDSLYYHFGVDIDELIEIGEYDYVLLCDNVSVGEGIISISEDEEAAQYEMDSKFIQYGGE